MTSNRVTTLALLTVLLSPLLATVAESCPAGTKFSGGRLGGFCLYPGRGGPQTPGAVAVTCRVADGSCGIGGTRYRSKNAPIRDYCCPSGDIGRGRLF
jgi:hypothetical protein